MFTQKKNVLHQLLTGAVTGDIDHFQRLLFLIRVAANQIIGGNAVVFRQRDMIKKKTAPECFVK